MTLTANTPESLLHQHLMLMVDYNQWMNEKIYQAARALTSDAIMEDQQAFFGSIFGTLQHIAVGDTVWISRIFPHCAPVTLQQDASKLEKISALNQHLFENIEDLWAYRQRLDELWWQFCESLKPEQLAQDVVYVDMSLKPMKKNLYLVLMHVFNHQTHHRGQASTLFSQMGVDIGATDLNARILNQSTLS